MQCFVESSFLVVDVVLFVGGERADVDVSL